MKNVQSLWELFLAGGFLMWPIVAMSVVVVAFGLERLWALQNLGKLDEALAAYRALADRGRTELAARARLMEGEVLFEQGNHKDAIKAFFKVAYGFGEKQAPAAFHPWQAQATFEAARCFEVLEKPDQAAKLYGELVDRYPDSEQTPAARKRLEALGSATPSAARKAS